MLKEKDKEVEKVRKNFDRGIITEVERYNRVIDLWMEARDQITKKMMTDLPERPAAGSAYRESGAVPQPDLPDGPLRRRGGVEQIRQLAGMRGLMAQAERCDHRDADQVELPRRL